VASASEGPQAVVPVVLLVVIVEEEEGKEEEEEEEEEVVVEVGELAEEARSPMMTRRRNDTIGIAAAWPA
jgi:hypothetical protein